MKQDILTIILQEYDQQCTLHTEFTEKMRVLIEELIKRNNVRIHSVTSRVKTRNDLKVKIEHSEDSYRKLSDITDIAGVRIITYLADEVDIIAEIIKKEFSIDDKKSIDKRKVLDPERFGYLSLHYIVKLRPERLKLAEYSSFKNCKAEIQIRSILQHTWAEIEHDLGYKSKQEVPKEIRRRFSRLAGLLELADDEFIQIRNSLFEYERAVPHKITNSPASVLIDKTSLFVYIQNSPLVRKIDEGIASRTAGKIKSKAGDIKKHSLSDVDHLKYVGLDTIADIDSALWKYETTIYSFAEIWIGGRRLGEVTAGICLFYLCYVIVGSWNSVEKAYKYLIELNIGVETRLHSNAQAIVDIYNKVVSNDKKT